ncbi:D-alanyl-D-alanine carboxypeptidase [Fusobacterium naviforme]|nr:D-alanyl-D-alanine carboxypeptidase [Fusobacterium naviforme]
MISTRSEVFILLISHTRRSAAAFCLALILLFTALASSRAAAAPAWPSNLLIQADGGILIDADSSCVIYGKNIHQRYYPASITKILTALIVIERCDLDETLTFSYGAVHNVESGSSSAGYDTGDQITVRQALYAMLLKSANEVANALAEHCAGSIEAFAGLMNEKAAALGCTDSHFVNPSGLNDENHYTTPYDFALIAQAAFENPTFVEFDSTTYYELPPNATNPESFMVYCGHKMLKKNSGQYYSGIIGGKTGYTLLAGNTLVTCAERDGLKLITVVLNGHQTHYSDTKTLLDFGFENFKNVNIQANDSRYSAAETDINLTGEHTPLLTLDDMRSVTLPKTAQFSDTRSELKYKPSDSAPPGAVAELSYYYEDRFIGNSWLCSAETAGAEIKSDDNSAHADSASLLHRLSTSVSALQAKTPLRRASFAALIALMAALLVLLILIIFLVQNFLRSARRSKTVELSRAVPRSRNTDPLLQQEKGTSDPPLSINRYPQSLRPRSRRRRPRRNWFRKG